MKPILYLDVEGTLLLMGAGRPVFRPHLEDLLVFVQGRLDRMTCYWLSSYSRGQIERLLSVGGLPAEGIGYQAWSGCKAEALSLEVPVLWVDDRLTERDQAVLRDRADAGARIRYRPIRRWAGEPQDQELLALRDDVAHWLGSGWGSTGKCRCEMVA
jgi:hypothetical protein